MKILHPLQSTLSLALPLTPIAIWPGTEVTLVGWTFWLPRFVLIFVLLSSDLGFRQFSSEKGHTTIWCLYVNHHIVPLDAKKVKILLGTIEWFHLPNYFV